MSKPKPWRDNRSRIARRAKAVAAELLLVCGGDRATVADRLLCHRAAFLTAEIETLEGAAMRGGGIDAALLARRTNSLVRLLDRLGIKRPMVSATMRERLIAERVETA